MNRVDPQEDLDSALTPKPVPRPRLRAGIRRDGCGRQGLGDGSKSRARKVSGIWAFPSQTFFHSVGIGAPTVCRPGAGCLEGERSLSQREPSPGVEKKNVDRGKVTMNRGKCRKKG